VSDTRHKNAQWNIRASADNTVHWDGVQVAVLMDIRDELQTLNATLGCYRVRDMADAMIRMERRGRPPRITKRMAARVLARKKRGSARRQKETT
jgi:hypothetical protein